MVKLLVSFVAESLRMRDAQIFDRLERICQHAFCFYSPEDLWALAHSAIQWFLTFNAFSANSLEAFCISVKKVFRFLYFFSLD